MTIIKKIQENSERQAGRKKDRRKENRDYVVITGWTGTVGYQVPLQRIHELLFNFSSSETVRPNAEQQF
jgi:uncharacterized protein (DUF927 family)